MFHFVSIMGLFAMPIPPPLENSDGPGVPGLLAHYDRNRVARAFAAESAPPPFVMWQPHPEVIASHCVRAFHELCNTLSGGASSIPDDRFDLAYFGAMRDWLMLAEPTEDGAAYRYAHYGKGIARIYGRDMTGKTSADFPGHLSAFFTAIYHDVTQRKHRVLTLHQPPHQVFVTTWRRLAVPIVDKSGTVVRILALNSPENELRAGLEVLPVSVLIVDADHIVRFANKEARKTFDEGNYGPWTRSVFDYGGLDLEIRERPEDILARGIAQTCTCRHVKLQRMGEYQATISAALYKDTAFYVMLLHQRA